MDGSNITRTITTGTGTGRGSAGITTKTAKAGKGKDKAKAKAKAKEARSLALCEQAAALVRAGISYRQRRRGDPHWLEELVGEAWLILHDRGERAEQRKKRQRAAAKSKKAPKEKKKPSVAMEVAKILRNALRDRRRLDARHEAGVAGRGEEVAWESAGEGAAQTRVVVDRCAPEAYAIASQTGAARIARATPRERRAVQALFDAAAAGGAS